MGFRCVATETCLFWLLVCYVISYLSEHADGVVWVEGIGQNRLNASVGASTSRTAAGYFGVMRGLKVRSRIGLAFMALLLSACGDGCSEDIMTSQWRFSEGSSENICQQFIDVRLERDISNQFVSIDLELKIWVDSPTRSIAVDHSSEYVKTDSTSGYFELTVGIPSLSDVVRSGSNVLRAIVFESSSEVAENALPVARFLSVTATRNQRCRPRPHQSQHQSQTVTSNSPFRT